MIRNVKSFLYSRRRICSEELGFNSFHDYLNSSVFSQVKALCFALGGTQCAFCENDGECVQFTKFSPVTMKGKYPEGLFTACQECFTEAQSMVPMHGIRMLADRNPERFREFCATRDKAIAEYRDLIRSSSSAPSP